LIGIAAGLVVGGVATFPALDRVSIFLWLAVTIIGGVFGYICWLSDHQARYERFQRVTSLFAVVAIAVTVFAFPGLGRWLYRHGGVAWCVCFLGAITGLSMFLVGAAWGLAQLVGYLLSKRRSEMKASTTSSFDGVWDRELDRNFPAGKL
jgi:hypothetical protein